MFKRITALLMVTILVCMTVSYTSEAKQNDVFERQDKSIMEYEKLKKSLEKESDLDYYGGCYIDDYGDLVVLVTDSKKEKIDKVKKTTENDQIKTRKVKYSYLELESIIRFVNENHEKLKDDNVEIMSVTDDVINNRVIIGIKNIDKKSVTNFKKYIKSDAIVFVEENEVEKSESYNVKGGVEIDNKTLGRSATLGFCATRQKYLGYGQYETVEGFVTASHGKWNVGDTIKLDGNSDKFGEIELQVLSANCDATFIEKTSSNAVLTDDVSYTDIDSVHMSSLPVGTYVTIYASQQGTNTGRILSTSASRTFDVGWAYDLVKCDYSAIGGDSGAPVMYGKQLLGIHKGGTTAEYFTKYSQVQGSLQCTPLFN